MIYTNNIAHTDRFWLNNNKNNFLAIIKLPNIIYINNIIHIDQLWLINNINNFFTAIKLQNIITQTILYIYILIECC